MALGLWGTCLALVLALTAGTGLRAQLGINPWFYGDPALGCRPGEFNFTSKDTGMKGSFCGPPCDENKPPGHECPTDYPPGSLGVAQCDVQLPVSAKPYCALMCDPGVPGLCAGNATCEPTYTDPSAGVCTYRH
jgi:hypothetical protein